jgi:hypothetical protein
MPGQDVVALNNRNYELIEQLECQKIVIANLTHCLDQALEQVKEALASKERWEQLYYKEKESALEKVPHVHVHPAECLVAGQTQPAQYTLKSAQSSISGHAPSLTSAHVQSVDQPLNSATGQPLPLPAVSAPIQPSLPVEAFMSFQPPLTLPDQSSLVLPSQPPLVDTPQTNLAPRGETFEHTSNPSPMSSLDPAFPTPPRSTPRSRAVQQLRLPFVEPAPVTRPSNRSPTPALKENVGDKFSTLSEKRPKDNASKLLVFRENISRLFSGVRKLQPTIGAPLSLSGGDGISAGDNGLVTPLLSININEATRTPSFTRKFTMSLVNILKEALDKKQNFLWTLIKITRDHYNALLVNTMTKTMTWFEPHGSNLADEGHATGGMHYWYDSQAFSTTLASTCRAALAEVGETSWKITMPWEYQPAVFGQAWTRDLGCSFWAVWFLIESTMTSPKMFVAAVQHAKQTNGLWALMHTRLDCILRGIEDPSWLVAALQCGAWPVE